MTSDQAFNLVEELVNLAIEFGKEMRDNRMTESEFIALHGELNARRNLIEALLRQVRTE